MNENHTNPNERHPHAFFRKASAPQVKTIPINSPADYPEETESPTLPMPGMPGATQPYMPFKPDQPIPAPVGNAAAPAAIDIGPVVGWLVILSGPGRGRSVEIGYGRNAIGRGHDNEVSLPFGDRGISDHAHAYIVYDAVGRKTYLTDGSSRNLVYLNGSPVFGTVEIQSGNTIRMGNSALMFIGFCSPELDWKDIPEKID